MMVEVWHANAEGLYENQEPDRQPELNLHGRFGADATGGLRSVTIRPRVLTLPEDRPVGRLMNRPGLRLDRPAHLHFRITAEGFAILTMHVFDRDDPAIRRDALFGVKPDLLAGFRPAWPDNGHRLGFTFILTAPDGADQDAPD